MSGYRFSLLSTIQHPLPTNLKEENYCNHVYILINGEVILKLGLLLNHNVGQNARCRDFKALHP